MAKTLTKVDQFKGVINSQTIKAQVYNSFKDKEMAGAFLSSMIDLYSGDSYLQKCDPEKVALEALYLGEGCGESQGQTGKAHASAPAFLRLSISPHMRSYSSSSSL